MKKLVFLVTLVAMMMITANLAFCQCATIKDGTITEARIGPLWRFPGLRRMILRKPSVSPNSAALSSQPRFSMSESNLI
jgi:hypothetical protein